MFCCELLGESSYAAADESDLFFIDHGFGKLDSCLKTDPGESGNVYNPGESANCIRWRKWNFSTFSVEDYGLIVQRACVFMGREMTNEYAKVLLTELVLKQKAPETNTEAFQKVRGRLLSGEFLTRCKQSWVFGAIPLDEAKPVAIKNLAGLKDDSLGCGAFKPLMRDIEFAEKCVTTKPVRAMDISVLLSELGIDKARNLILKNIKQIKAGGGEGCSIVRQFMSDREFAKTCLSTEPFLQKQDPWSVSQELAFDDEFVSEVTKIQPLAKPEFERYRQIKSRRDEEGSCPFESECSSLPVRFISEPWLKLRSDSRPEARSNCELSVQMKVCVLRQSGQWSNIRIGKGMSVEGWVQTKDLTSHEIHTDFALEKLKGALLAKDSESIIFWAQWSIAHAKNSIVRADSSIGGRGGGRYTLAEYLDDGKKWNELFIFSAGGSGVVRGIRFGNDFWILLGAHLIKLTLGTDEYTEYSWDNGPRIKRTATVVQKFNSFEGHKLLGEESKDSKE